MRCPFRKMRNYVDLIVLVPQWRVLSNIFLASYWSAGLGTFLRQGQGKLINKTPLTLSEAPAASQTTLSLVSYTPLVINIGPQKRTLLGQPDRIHVTKSQIYLTN